MSLPDSPLIRTDALDRRLEPLVVGSSLLAALCWPICVGGESAPLGRAILAVLSLGLLWCAWRSAGWCGGKTRVRRGVWSPDGHWTLEFADGGTTAARLTSATRRLGPIVLLAWRTQRGRSYVLASAGPRARPQFRRLAARLRLEGHRAGPPAATADTAA